MTLPARRHIADVIPLPVIPNQTANNAAILRYAAAILAEEATHQERLAALTQQVPCPTGCGANLATMSEVEQVAHWNTHGVVSRWQARIRGWAR